jgi:hypothetical protein
MLKMLILTKMDKIFGDFFTNSSGHPANGRVFEATLNPFK